MSAVFFVEDILSLPELMSTWLHSSSQPIDCKKYRQAGPAGIVHPASMGRRRLLLHTGLGGWKQCHAHREIQSQRRGFKWSFRWRGLKQVSEVRMQNHKIKDWGVSGFKEKSRRESVQITGIVSCHQDRPFLYFQQHVLNGLNPFKGQGMYQCKHNFCYGFCYPFLKVCFQLLATIVDESSMY